MKHSSDRILTTHVGSLPRPSSVGELLLRKELDQPYNPAEFDSVIAAGVAEIVARQVSLGVDVVSDGEMSKISYATYIHDRLAGFGGDVERQVALDLLPYPDFRHKMARMTGTQPMRRTACMGPVAMRDPAPLQKDIANFRTAVAQSRPVDAFLTAASPGVVSAFQPNRFYATHEKYVEAVAATMQEEYEAIARAGFILQVDCPDLAMAHHTGFQDLSEAEFLKRAAFHVELLNHALANIPADNLRMHVCWGNYEGPHDYDIPLDTIINIVLRAKPSAISFEASNPRHAHEWTVWRDAKIPGDKLLIPGVLDTSTNFVEHPELVAQRICRFAEIVGRERVIAGSDCGFGTFAGYGKMDPDIAFKKLGAMVEGAAIASHRLWKS